MKHWLTILLLANVGLLGCTPARILTYSGTEIRHPTPQPGVWFGHAVAGVGDVNGDGVPDFVVGAPYQEVGGYYGQGRAYVISGADQSVIHTLDSPNGYEAGKFGRAVAGIADVDGDGRPDIAVGAQGEPGLVVNSDYPTGIWYESVGRVYIFSGQTGALIRVINNPAAQGWNEFGASLSSIGDLDGDGVPDLVVGTPSFHGYRPLLFGSATWFCPMPAISALPPRPPLVPVCWQGRVYVFSARTGALLRTIEHPSPQELGFFGYSVAGAPDLDGDSVPDLVVGAPLQRADLLGEAYVISGQTGAPIRAIASPQPQRIGNFGWSVAVNPSGEILVGAPGESPASEQYQGRAWVFRGTDGSVLRGFDRPSALARAHFGWVVAVAGNVNGDTVPDWLIGSPGEYRFSDPSPQGSAFLFDGATGNLIRELAQPTPQATSAYGRAAATIGDVSNDGRSDHVVGAPYWTPDDANPFSGAVYVFKSRLRWPWWCNRFLPCR